MRKYKKLSIYKYAAQRHQKIDALNESFTAHIRKTTRIARDSGRGEITRKIYKNYAYG